jgi:hypothetical protein
MAVNLSPQYAGTPNPDDYVNGPPQNPWAVTGYTDQLGRGWQQTPNGWQVQNAGNWTAADPNYNAAYDLSPYQAYLGRAAGALGYTDPSLSAQAGDFVSSNDPTTYGMGRFQNDPLALQALFNSTFSGRGTNINPYASLAVRDGMRQVAQKLGLTADDADKVALQVAQGHLNDTGETYSEATHPALIADEIAQKLFAKAGKSDEYTPLTTAQKGQYINQAAAYQQQLKEGDADSWKKDSVGGILGTIDVAASDRFKANAADPERALLGAEGPLGTYIWNKALNQDWDPTMNLYGGPTGQDYQQASREGVDTNGASVIQAAIDSAAGIIGGGAITSGLTDAGLSPTEAAAVSGAGKAAAGAVQNPNADTNDVLNAALMGTAGSASGLAGENIGPEAATAADAANRAYQISKAYENDNPLGLIGGVSGLGNLYAKADTGTLTDAGPDAGLSAPSSGTTGGGMWDEYGNWVNNTDTSQPDYSQGYYGSDASNSNSGQGFDEFGNPIEGQTGAINTGSSTDLSGGLDTGGSQSILDYLKGAGGSLQGLLGGLLGGTDSGGAGSALNLQKLLGALGGSSLGIAGSKNVANKYDAMNNQYMGFSQPYRDQLSQLYSNPDSFLNSQAVQAPVQQGTNALARSLSVNGNPAGSPAAMGEIQDYASQQLFGRLGEEKNRLAALSGIPQFNTAAPVAASNAAQNYGGQYTAAGSGLADLTNQSPSLSDYLKKLGLA